mmetsp:Transcript_5797/g.7580  ORF Transcript_5797/g.7580 Transcript_5797/m.7580 type:complete len:237 (-) Transcript_5797:217-927(-)
MPGEIIVREHGQQLDHVGLAVRNLDQGIEYVKELTGVTPDVHPPEKGQPYQSASVRIAEDSFLEILAPNKRHWGFHPLKSILRSFSKPTLFFWYVATDSFDDVEKRIKDAGRTIERKVVTEKVDREKHSEYIRSMIGPGFYSIMPNLIEWKHKSNGPMNETICPLVHFELSSPDAENINNFFTAVGINQEVLLGQDRMSLTLDSPKGKDNFQNEAITISNWKAMSILVKDMLGYYK